MPLRNLHTDEDKLVKCDNSYAEDKVSFANTAIQKNELTN